MQLIPVYLYPNKVDVYTNVPGVWTSERYRRVYNRTVKLFRGVDNRIDIQVRNSDEKALDVTGFTVSFNLVRHGDQSLVFTKSCTPIDVTKGRYYVTVTEQELYEINNGAYQYSIHKTNTVGAKTPMYIDSQYGALANIEVVGDIKGNPTPSLEVTSFAYVEPSVFGETADPYYVSSLIDANYYTSLSRTNHTFALYSSAGYTGNLLLQGSLSDSADPVDWVDIDTVSLVSDTLVYHNTVGKWRWFRFTQKSHVGEMATFTIQQTVLGNYIVDVDWPGQNYTAGEQLLIRGNRLAGTIGTNDLHITITSVNGSGQITGISYSGQSIIDFRTFVLSGSSPTPIGKVDKILYR